MGKGKGTTHSRDQAVGAVLVAAALPPHAAAESQVLDQARLLADDVGRVVRNEGPSRGVVAPRRDERGVLGDGGAGLGQRLVVVHASLPGALADAGEGFTGTVGVGEGAAVEGHAEHDLGGRDAVRGVVVDHLLGVEGRGGWVAGRGVPVRVVSGVGVPGTGVVVGPVWTVVSGCWLLRRTGNERREDIHEVPEVKVLVHAGEVKLLVVCGASWGCDGQEEMLATCACSGVCVKLLEDS